MTSLLSTWWSLQTSRCSSGRSTPNFGLLAAWQRSTLFWRHLGPAPGQSIDDGVLLLRGATEKEPAGKSCGGRRWCLGVIWCLHLILVLPELAFLKYEKIAGESCFGTLPTSIKGNQPFLQRRPRLSLCNPFLLYTNWLIDQLNRFTHFGFEFINWQRPKTW